jgi:hypothetical protein
MAKTRVEFTVGCEWTPGVWKADAVITDGVLWMEGPVGANGKTEADLRAKHPAEEAKILGQIQRLGSLANIPGVRPVKVRKP